MPCFKGSLRAQAFISAAPCGILAYSTHSTDFVLRSTHVLDFLAAGRAKHTSLTHSHHHASTPQATNSPNMSASFVLGQQQNFRTTHLPWHTPNLQPLLGTPPTRRAQLAATRTIFGPTPMAVDENCSRLLTRHGRCLKAASFDAQEAGERPIPRNLFFLTQLPPIGGVEPSGLVVKVVWW